MTLLPLACWFGHHPHWVRDREADGRQVLRCPDCWRVRDYPSVNADALRARQRAQAELLRAERAARDAVLR